MSRLTTVPPVFSQGKQSEAQFEKNNGRFNHMESTITNQVNIVKNEVKEVRQIVQQNGGRLDETIKEVNKLK